MLRDGRVILRRWCATDADAVFDACQDPDIQDRVPSIPRPYTREHAREFVVGESGVPGSQWAITIDDIVVGSIGLRTEDRGVGVIGYWLAPIHRGRGLATSALRLVSSHGFEDLGLARLELVIDTDNIASQRVAAAVGFACEEGPRSDAPPPEGHGGEVLVFSLRNRGPLIG